MISELSSSIRSICLSFPEARVEPVEGEGHLIFKVRKRTFAYFLVDHHGDGEIAVSCKVEPGHNLTFAEGDPATYFLPKYLHHRGWVSARVDQRSTDWDEIEGLIDLSYRLVAPRSLVRQIDEPSK